MCKHPKHLKKVEKSKKIFFKKKVENKEEEEDKTLTTTWSDAEIMPGRMLTTSRPNANAGSVRNNMRAGRGVGESEDNRDTQEAQRPTEAHSRGESETEN